MAGGGLAPPRCRGAAALAAWRDTGLSAAEVSRRVNRLYRFAIVARGGETVWGLLRRPGGDGGDVEELQLLAMRPEADAPDGLPVLWYHSERSYSPDGTARVSVSPGEHNALQAFLKTGASLTTAQLESRGVSNAPRTMRRLDRRLPGRVSFPRNKGDGYFVHVLARPASRVATASPPRR